MVLDDAPRLGCARSIDQIWAGIDRPPSVHEEHCQPCETARTQLQELNQAKSALAESDLQNPQLKLRPDTTSTIMDLARAEVRRGQRLLVRSTENGSIEISEQALSGVIRQAATTIPGIHSRRCHIDIYSGTNESATNTFTAIPGTDPELIINLRVAASADINIPQTVTALRDEIHTALTSGIGMGAGTVNITVEDLYDV